MDQPSALINQPNPKQQLKQLVLDSVTALESKRAYGRAIDNFFIWVQSKGSSTKFTKSTVQDYRAVLIASGLSSSTVSLNLTAIRKLANEASDNGLIAPDLASAIGRVKGVKREGLRLGNWLTILQAERLLNTPDVNTLKGKRDKALLAVMIGCGLRREETARLSLEHIQQRSGRWVIVDMFGKGGRVRSIPMPSFTKATIDIWSAAAGFTTGRVFRSVNKAGKVVGEKLSAQSIFEIVKQYSAEIQLENISPHNLRRTFARLSHSGKSSLEQIQL